MQSIHDYLITPVGERYNNKKKSGLIVNTEMQNHLYVNRVAEVLSIPLIGGYKNIEVGDKVLVHHNIFRRFYDIRGKAKNSRAYMSEDKYLCPSDQIYMVNKGEGWEALPGFTFVQPVKEDSIWATEKEVPLCGIVVFEDKENQHVKKDDVVAFVPSSEFEFILNGMKLYRILSNNITVNNGRKENEVAYNPRWAKGS